nr:MAG TPA: hypothetical protein [Caudoviricetes sp.]
MTTENISSQLWRELRAFSLYLIIHPRRGKSNSFVQNTGIK